MPTYKREPEYAGAGRGRTCVEPAGPGPAAIQGAVEVFETGAYIYLLPNPEELEASIHEDGVRMDAFEEMAAKMAGMSDAELKKTVSSLMARCICGKCPTYNDCMKNKKEALYCALGKSACAITKKACLCPTCPVTAMLGLKHGYYCIKGSEKELRGL